MGDTWRVTMSACYTQVIVNSYDAPWLLLTCQNETRSTTAVASRIENNSNNIAPYNMVHQTSKYTLCETPV